MSLQPNFRTVEKFSKNPYSLSKPLPMECRQTEVYLCIYHGTENLLVNLFSARCIITTNDTNYRFFLAIKTWSWKFKSEENLRKPITCNLLRNYQAHGKSWFLHQEVNSKERKKIHKGTPKSDTPNVVKFWLCWNIHGK